MNISPTGKIGKDWGYEIVWASNQFYCGKILVFEKAGAETTVVIHKDRKKSWFINAGRFQIIFTDIKTGKIKSIRDIYNFQKKKFQTKLTHDPNQPGLGTYVSLPISNIDLRNKSHG